MITSFFEPLFYIYFVYFLLAITLSCIIPGYLFVRSLPIKNDAKIIIGSIVGMVIVTFLGIIFGYISMRWLTYLYIVVSLLLWVRWYGVDIYKNRFYSNEISQYVKKINVITVLFIVIGTIAILSPIFFVGTKVTNGITFCCGHSPDNIMHIAYVNELSQRFPPYESGAYGVIIKNYHYLGHLFVGDLIRVYKLPLLATSFQYVPLFLSVLMGLLLLAISDILKLSTLFKRWLLFFFYLGGDFIYFLSLVLGKGFNISYSPVETGIGTWINYPLAFSVAVFLGGVYLFIIWIRNRNFYSGLLYAILFGSLIGFKVYVGFFTLSGLAALGLFFLIRRQFSYTLFPIISLVISLTLYLPVNAGAGGLVFTGFWKADNFIVSSPLGLSHLELAKQVFLAHSNWIRVIAYEILFMFLFLFATFGTKFIGLIQTKKSLSYFPPELHILFLSGMLACFILGMFFIQQSGGANTVFFIIVIYIVSSFYTALSCMFLQKKLRGALKMFFISAVIILTIPLPLFSIYRYYVKGATSPADVTNEELVALDFIQKNTDPLSLFIVDPKIRLDYQTPYVSFLANRPMYLSGQLTELGEHNIKLPDRVTASTIIFNSTDADLVRQTLSDADISYVYLFSSMPLPCCRQSMFLTEVLRNNTIQILKVTK